MLFIQDKIITTNEKETANAAYEFASYLRGNEIIALNGELGAGKTFFIKHLLKQFGISNVNSPTFSIVNEYNGTVKVNHFDFYRINKIEELYDIGFDEYINDSSLTVIEWAELYPAIIPKKHIEITIKVNENYSREINFREIK